jgi:hypothetical protein
MWTWDEIQTAKKRFMLTLGSPLPDWFCGVGIGFELMQNSYNLQIRVQKDEHKALAEDVIERMHTEVPYQIQAVGDIKPLTVA